MVPCRNKGILFVAIDQNRPLSDQGRFDIVLHKLSGKKWQQILELVNRIMDTSEAPMHRILRSSVTQTRTETPSTSSAATQPSGEADGSNSISQQPIMEGDGNTSQTRPQPSGGPVRKGRGKAKNIALHKAQDLYGKDVPIPVEFGTGYIKPVGKNHNLWTAEVGIHARDKEALLKYKTWREIPDYERQVCYDHFKLKESQEKQERQNEEDEEVESPEEGPAIRMYKDTHFREETR
ncbi:uncharacterized protein LOC132306185 isoform X2 [Cornus florida]|uniref:uncharacterized protein LOC132306185 isoform X2 n=1 Tax=Cornus florida TaxID=4283 RepID=UPI00289C1D8B|nr:uncharacterized protein LOC132306185 isoform X2 [Cornus florida]